MREIKFRAWNGKQMIYSGDTFIFGKTAYPKLEYVPISWIRGDSNDMVWMQYTGLKDKNGKEIYEGDILLRYSEPDEPEYEKVVIFNPKYTKEERDKAYREHELFEESNDEDATDKDYEKYYHKYYLEVPIEIEVYVVWQDDETAFTLMERFINDADEEYEPGFHEDHFLSDSDTMEVLGNIYENPKLLA